MKTRVSTIIVILGVLFFAGEESLGCGGCGNAPPEAVLTATPDSGVPDVNVTLDGSESTDDGGITKYEWDFDYNGTFNCDYEETEANHPDGAFDGITTHTYTNPGVYTVMLRVTDDGGCGVYLTDTDICAVTVRGIKNVDKNKWYGTIQAAINDANSGNHILVYPGKYVENVDFNGVSCTLKSTDPNDWDVVADTIIDANGSGSVVDFGDSEVANYVLKGFTLTGGTRGVECHDSPIISNCIIRDNDSASLDGGGIYVSSCIYASSPVITNCFIINNSGKCGGGMYNYNSFPKVSNCVFSWNSADANGGGIYNNNSVPVVTNCTFTHNYAEDFGGGMYSSGSSSEPNIINCIFWGNDSNDAGDEIYNASSADPTIRYCDVNGCKDANGVWDPNFGTDGGGNIDEDPLFLLDPNLISYWKLDEGSGTKAYDVLGHNNGTVSGATWTSGRFRGALSFDGVNDQVYCGMPVELEFLSQVSMVAWIYWHDTNNTYYFIAGEELVHKIEIKDSHIRFLTGNDWNGAILTSSIAIEPNVWHYVAATYDGSVKSLYIDGVKDPHTVETSGDVSGVGNQFRIGAKNGSPEFFDGKIDNVMIFNRALSAAEVRRLYFGMYHLGSGSPCVNSGDPNGDYSGQKDIDGEPRVSGGVDIGADEVCRVYNVNGNKWYATINDAIDDAGSGDEIILYRATYTGTGNRDLDFKGKAITIRSEEPNDWDVVEATVLDCNGTRNSPHRGFHFHSGEDANSVISGLTITNGYGDVNDGLYAGGAIFCDKNSSPKISRCIIKNNTNDKNNDDVDGGGIACYNGASPQILNCIIKDNTAYWGGGISCWLDCTPVIKNCIITNNSAVSGGGVIRSGCSVIANCTFSKNSADGDGSGGICSDDSPGITNCIFWGNQPYEIVGLPVITYSDVKGGRSGTGNISSDPCFVDSDANVFHLKSGSPCVNSGDPNGNYSGQKDIDGEPRIMGGRVDIGVDEVFRVYNVNGDKWYATINDAIDDASSGNQISVYPGTYYENVNFDGKAITLRSTDPNDWSVVAGTIIEGDGSEGTVTFDSNDANSVVRGFAIRCGEYGVSCAVSASIKQCIIADNNSYGVYCTGGSANISNNKIYGNNGAGIYSSSGTPPTIKNNEIYDNGKGIELDSGNSAATIRNNTIVDNTNYGIKKTSGTAPAISNCIIWDCNDDLAGCSTTYSCIQDGNTGTGNISNDPCFVDSDANDFHLKSGSPCINEGDSNGNYAGEVDIDGFGRVIGGEGDVRIVDMGADEWESQIPELDWPEERSDWINVKTDVTPAAVGDGVADDTEALQKALDQITPDTGVKKTVYLPPGTYRITQTLQLTTQEELIQGGLILGHGRATRIVWDGNEGGTMLWTTKAGYFRYIGQIWDGKGKAAIGIYHHSTVQQRLVRHRNQAFLNFTDAGIRTDALSDGVGATDGVFFENCLFENCTNGVSIGALGNANCYLNWFDGCEFRNCGRGIYCYTGNIGVCNCHFEGSTNTDIFTTVDMHGKQIRRCSSIDSRMFLTDDMDWYISWGNPQIVEDCHISGWTETNGAIILGSRGPTTIFDCNFTKSPDYNKPPIRLVNPNTMKQLLVISDCHSDTNDLYYADTCGSHVTEVPAGKYSPFISSATRSFLRGTWRIPGKVFDAKEDFNAVGNGIADDSNAIQATINAAKDYGNDAIAYIPEGTYKVTRTIDVNGADYFIGGAGVCGTVINYFGSEGGVVFNVNDPCNIVMEFIHIYINDVCDMTTVPVRQTGSSGNSFILYDGVYGPRNTGQLGWEFEDLPYGAKVHLLEVGGSLDIKNSSRATILVNAFDASKCHVVVEGNEPNRDGFLGITAGYSDQEPYQLHVKDNQSIVWANWYQESAYRHIKLEGNANLPVGHVSVAGMKTFSWEQDFITIDNYQGNFFHSGSAIGWNPPGGYAYNQPVEVNQTGTNPVNMMFVGEMFYYKDPNFVYDANAATLILVENIVLDGSDAKHCVDNNIPPGSLNTVRDALDEFRKLGEVDLLFNHPD